MKTRPVQMRCLIHSALWRQKGIKKAIIQQQYGRSKNSLIIGNAILTTNSLRPVACLKTIL